MPETRKFIYSCERDQTPTVNFDAKHPEWFANRSFCLHPAGCGIQSNYMDIENRIPSVHCPEVFNACNKLFGKENYRGFGECMAKYRCSCG